MLKLKYEVDMYDSFPIKQVLVVFLDLIQLFVDYAMFMVPNVILIDFYFYQHRDFYYRRSFFGMRHIG